MKRCPECGLRPTCSCSRPTVAQSRRQEFRDNVREKESLAFIYYNERTRGVEVETSDGRQFTLWPSDTLTLWRSASIGGF